MDSQLPCAVTELGTSLADMKMKHLFVARSVFQPGVSRNQSCVAAAQLDKLVELSRRGAMASCFRFAEIPSGLERVTSSKQKYQM